MKIKIMGSWILVGGLCMTLASGCSVTRNGSMLKFRQPSTAGKSSIAASPSDKTSAGKKGSAVTETATAKSSPGAAGEKPSGLVLRNSSSPGPVPPSRKPETAPALNEGPACAMPVIEQVSATAKPPSEVRREDGTSCRLHIRFSSDETFNHFQKAWKERHQIREDLEVLARVSEEISGELEKAQQGLQDEFGIQPDRQYRFDAAQNTIFEVSTDRADEAPRVHRRLSTEEQRRQFAGAITARDNARIQVQALNMTIREKRASQERVQESLLREYAMSRDRDYEVSASDRTLYEIIRAPAALNAPGADKTR